RTRSTYTNLGKGGRSRSARLTRAVESGACCNSMVDPSAAFARQYSLEPSSFLSSSVWSATQDLMTTSIPQAHIHSPNTLPESATPCMPEEIILAAVSSSPVRTRAIQYDFAAQVVNSSMTSSAG